MVELQEGTTTWNPRSCG